MPWSDERANESKEVQREDKTRSNANDACSEVSCCVDLQ